MKLHIFFLSGEKIQMEDDYEVYDCEEFQMEGDPTSFE